MAIQKKLRELHWLSTKALNQIVLFKHFFLAKASFGPNVFFLILSKTELRVLIKVLLFFQKKVFNKLLLTTFLWSKIERLYYLDSWFSTFLKANQSYWKRQICDVKRPIFAESEVKTKKKGLPTHRKSTNFRGFDQTPQGFVYRWF